MLCLLLILRYQQSNFRLPSDNGLKTSIYLTILSKASYVAARFSVISGSRGTAEDARLRRVGWGTKTRL